MKKRSLFFVFAVAVSLCGCARREYLAKSAAVQNVKVGFIYNGKINDGGFVQAQDLGRIALERKGVRTMYVENVPDSDICITVIEELIRQGCKMIFATSSGYEGQVSAIASKYPKVKFAQYFGHAAKENISCYSDRTYEARYLAGIVAGLKTTANKIGYVTAFLNPDHIRGINAFTLGVRSLNPDATVYVRWTNSLDNPHETRFRAEELLIAGCDILTQDLESTILYSISKEKGAFLICNNYPAPEMAADSYLTTVCSNWNVFVLDEVSRLLEGTWESRIYWEGLSSGVVSLGELSKNCAPGTKSAVEEATRKILSGELNVFAGPIYDMRQVEMVAEGAALEPCDLLEMDWFVEGVKLNNY